MDAITARRSPSRAIPADATQRFRRAIRDRGAWLEATALGACLFLPLAVAGLLGRETVGGLYVAINEHALVEAFCSLVALLIAGMGLTIAVRRRDAAALVFASAFLAMGGFDLVHAATDPHGEHLRFVLFHTLSTVGGGVLILAAAVLHLRSVAPHEVAPRRFLASLTIGAAFVGIAALCYSALMPRIALEDAGVFAFAPAVYAIHKVAAVLYATTAVLLYRHFRARPTIAVALAVLFFLFAESAYLFAFSTLWDFHWWMWHGVKAMFYVGTLVFVFAGFVAMLSVVERGRAVLEDANLRLQAAMKSVERVNEKLLKAEEVRTRGERLALLGQMAASVAHEVRNPLAAISNCLAVLRDDPGRGAASGSALEIIEGEVRRLARLTNDFLAFGRPRPTEHKPVLLADVVDLVHGALLRHLAQEEMAVAVRVSIEGRRQPVLFDRDGFEAVLWNLALNAAQSIEGSGIVDIRLRYRGDRFLLAVIDDGRGIASAQRAQIFEPFVSSRSHGAGLGLAIVARHVQEWRGRIRVRSRPGAGTAFLILARLPRAIPADADARAAVTLEAA